MEELYYQIKDYYINNNYKGNNTVIKTQNVVFQISKYEEQENIDFEDISSINLYECEEKLKKENEIPQDESLIIYKIDIKTEDLTQTYVQYEIYNPLNLEILDLSLCKDVKISISTPVKLDNSTSSLYDSLKNSGYDLFNENDSFYSDICSTYTSENGTDIIISDRRIIYKNNANISICQSGCELEYYNSTNKKANCNCFPQTEETDPDLKVIIDKFEPKMITDSFLNTLKNSNFLVLKCFELLLEFKNILKNKGRIFMSVVLLLSFVLLLVFYFYDYKKI